MSRDSGNPSSHDIKRKEFEIQSNREKIDSRLKRFG